MSDISRNASDLPIVIIGASTTGVPTTPVFSSANGDLNVRDIAGTVAVYGAVSVTTTAALAKVGATALANRKFLSLVPTNGTIYWGTSSAVTTTTGMPVFKNQNVSLSFTENITVYVISAGTVDVRLVEGS